MPVIETSLRGLFFVSGVSGLMYEVIWVRMLGRILGNTVEATAIVLSAFMAGIGLGSLLIGRYADRVRRPLLVYGILELGIAGAAILSLELPGWLGPIYRTLSLQFGDSRAFASAAQVAFAFLFLVVPTALMGATFPALCAFGSRRHSDFAREIGILYALNTFGGVVGVLWAGFISIGAFGETNTALQGVALNVLVSLFAAALSWAAERSASDARSPEPGAVVDPWDGHANALPAERPDRPDDPHVVRRAILIAMGASGFIALASQVVWGRMLLLYQGTSIYAFSSMLAVILGGMAIGSYSAGRAVGKRSDSVRFLANLQACVGFFTFISLTLFGLGDTAKPDLDSGKNLSMMIFAPLVFLAPLGFIWGAIFPVAVNCYARDRALGGRACAELYTCNTLGCIAGAIVAGFLMIPRMGVSASAVALAVASGLISALIFIAHPGRRPRGSWAAQAALFAGIGLIAIVAGDPYRIILAQKMDQEVRGAVKMYRYEESSTATVAVFGRADNSRAEHLWVDGSGMTALVSVTKLMAHLPLWLADDPKDALVICFGMGTTVRSASRHPGLEIWVVDRVPTVFESFPFFHPGDPALLRRPNIHTVVDDGRNFLLMSPRSYDVITVDPAPPLYSAGAVSLYSREFFQLCYDRLRPHGIMCLWVPEGNASEFKAIMRTFFEVFPESAAWNSPMQETLGGCYLIGARHPIQGVEERIRRGFKDREVVADLTEWGNDCDSPEKILRLLVADRSRLVPLLKDVPVITDDRPYTEFPLWRALSAGTDYSSRLNGNRLRRQLGRVSEEPSSRTESSGIERPAPGRKSSIAGGL